MSFLYSETYDFFIPIESLFKEKHYCSYEKTEYAV